VSQERLSWDLQGFVIFLSIVRVPVRDWVAETRRVSRMS